MATLHELRQQIAACDIILVDTLCARAALGYDPGHYRHNGHTLPDAETIAQSYVQADSLTARINILHPACILYGLPILCGDAPQANATPAADLACLDALNQRLLLSIQVAAQKRASSSRRLQAALEAGDPQRVEKAITLPEVEANVLKRAANRATKKAANAATAERVLEIYRDWILPISRKIQVEFLLTDTPAKT